MVHGRESLQDERRADGAEQCVGVGAGAGQGNGELGCGDGREQRRAAVRGAVPPIGRGVVGGVVGDAMPHPPFPHNVLRGLDALVDDLRDLSGDSREGPAEPFDTTALFALLAIPLLLWEGVVDARRG